MKIAEISPENRPRERLKRDGIETLSNAEILAIILQKGNRKENVIDMSNRLISTYSINKLSNCSLQELQQINGIGEVKAMQIQAVFELQKRTQTDRTKTIIKSAKDVYEYCKPKIGDKLKEYFMILLLDTKNKIIKDETISIGTLNSSIIHPREVFKTAIKESANSIILVHNHPSGDPEPSQEDEEITKELTKAGELIGIKVLDHVIIGKDEWYSFKDN